MNNIYKILEMKNEQLFGIMMDRLLENIKIFQIDAKQLDEYKNPNKASVKNTLRGAFGNIVHYAAKAVIIKAREKEAFDKINDIFAGILDSSQLAIIMKDIKKPEEL